MGLKYEKTDEDKKIEERDLATNRTLKHLKDINFYKFEVGDVLVREERWGDEQPWKQQLAACGLPYKYVYVFENELGVGYIRRLSIDGSKFVEAPVCVVNFDPQRTRFHLDPAYADQILMGDADKMDMKSDYQAVKRKKAALWRKNDKIRIQMKSADDAIAFINTLNVGDKLWMGFNRSTVNKDHYTVAAKSIDPLSPAHSYLALKPSWAPGRNYNYYADRIFWYHWFKQKPHFLDDML